MRSLGVPWGGESTCHTDQLSCPHFEGDLDAELVRVLLQVVVVQALQERRRDVPGLHYHVLLRGEQRCYQALG